MTGCKGTAATTNLEEGGLGRIHSSGTAVDPDVVRGSEADTGGGSDLVLLDLGLDGAQVT